MINSYTYSDIEEMDFVKRLNLINSITGVKPANLIGTKSIAGQENLAIISSVVHLGSHPAMIGFIMRPTQEAPRHTYTNIVETQYYTINSVGEDVIKQAHYTSAKFGSDDSEFENCNFLPEYHDDFYAPFVGGSSIQIGMKVADLLSIKQNGTILVVGNIEYINVDGIGEDGKLDLGEMNLAGISGLNSYYGLNKVGDFPYARPSEVPEFK